MVGAASQWTSRSGFLLAAVGFAVGLGNIWRFPYIAGENGGGAFVLVYLLCAAAIGVPILIAELTIGRAGGKSPPESMRHVAEQTQSPPAWGLVGGLHLATAFLIAVAYLVVAGWVFSYLFEALQHGFSGFDRQHAEATFAELQASVATQMLWVAVTLIPTVAIIYFGVQNGIERSVRVLMPTLLGLLVLLAVYNIFAGGFSTAVSYLFSPDFTKIDGGVFLAAVGQAFFSIGVAMGGMMTFGAYLPQWVSIPRSALIIVLADTGVALLAGFVIFPVVFNNGLDAAGGPGLIFQTLPVAFAQMPGGWLIGILFFVLLSFAAVTSLVGLLECIVAWLTLRLKMSRRIAALSIGADVFIVSIVSVLSYNYWAQVEVFGMKLGTAIDFVPNQIMLPIGGLLIALFAGWVMTTDQLRDELRIGERLFRVWHVLIRYLVPLAVLVIFISGL